MHEKTTTSASPVYEYEKISPSPVRSPYENNTQHRLQQQTPFYISFESKSSDAISTVSNTIPIIPSFQRQFPTITVAILGFFELFSGVIILAFELYTFDLALGLWCGGFYTLAGIAIVVLVTSTDIERHQTSIVLILQLVALAFTIIDILLHSESYRQKCITKPNEPSRENIFHCQIALIQIVAAIIMLASTIVFSIIYFRVTMVVLKQPYGTFNMSNAINLTTC